MEQRRAAFLYLFTHELFHYIVDNACSVMEIVTKDPHIYKKYSKNVYAKVSITLSNALRKLLRIDIYRKMRSIHIHENYLFHALKNQSGGTVISEISW